MLGRQSGLRITHGSWLRRLRMIVCWSGFAGWIGGSVLLCEEGKDDARKDAKKAEPAKAGEKTPEKPARVRPKDPPAFEWLSLELGLAQVRQKYLPALVLYDRPDESSGAGISSPGESAPGAAPGGAPGGAADGGAGVPVAPAEARPASGAPSFLDDYLADSAMKDILKHFVLLRVSAEDLKRTYPAPSTPVAASKKKENAGAGDRGADRKKKGSKGSPKSPSGSGEGTGSDAPTPQEGSAGDVSIASTVGAKLGLGGELSALVVLSYWEDAVESYRGKLPSRTKLKADLSRFWKVNKIYADEARRVEPEMEKSRYAAKLGNQRDAVLKVRSFEDPKAQNRMDPVLKKKVSELIQDYRAKARKATDEADKLDDARKYTQAIEAFDRIMTDFPFKDVLEHANKRKNECLRKLTLGV